MNQVNIVLTGLLSKSVLPHVGFMTSSEELKSVSYTLTWSSEQPREVSTNHFIINESLRSKGLR